MKKSASAVLNTRLASKHKTRTRIPSVKKTTTLTTYPQVVSYLLQTYATDENIADTKDEITMFSQPPNKTLSQYAEELVAKALRCGDVYKEHDLNEIFIEGLDKSIRRSMRGYWASRETASLHGLAFHATSLLKLNGGQQGLPSCQAGVKPQNRQAAWQASGKTINAITSSDLEITSIGQESRAEPD